MIKAVKGKHRSQVIRERQVLEACYQPKNYGCLLWITGSSKDAALFKVPLHRACQVKVVGVQIAHLPLLLGADRCMPMP